jgi:maleate isomerase
MYSKSKYMSLGFGTLARIGQLYPSGGLCDYEIQLMAPEGVQFVTTRVPFKKTDINQHHVFCGHLEKHASLLVDAGVDLIAVNCTAVTMLAGPERIRQRLFSATAKPTLTTIDAVLCALKHQGMQRIGLLTPYPNEVVQAEVRYLASHGVEVVLHRGTPCNSPIEQGSFNSQHWFEVARQFKSAAIDGLLISCAGIQIAHQLDAIEHYLQRPVVASNQALLWHCLQHLNLNLPSHGYGSLLA